MTFELWSLFDPSVARDLVDLSHNFETERENDDLVRDFVSGHGALNDLFELTCHSIAPHATSCLIEELSFSELKVEQKANQTDLSVDQRMSYMQNIVHYLREDRMDAVSHYKSGRRHNHSIMQIQLACEQVLGIIIPRYSPERMQDMPSRHSFEGALTRARKASGKMVAESVEAKSAQSNRGRITDEEWESKQRDLGSQLSRHEARLEKIEAITDGERVVAVLMEETVVWQVGRTACF